MEKSLEFEIYEDCFEWEFGKNKHYGLLIMENKLKKWIFIESLNKESVSVSFMPIKSGYVVLKSI